MEVDSFTINNLKDKSVEINKRFSKLEEKFKKSDDITSIKKILDEIEIRIDTMESDKNSLNDENKKDLWKKNISKIKSKYELYKKKYENMEAFEKEEKDNDPENIDDNNLTIEGAMKRGNQILDKDDKILGELVDIITTDNKTLMVIKNDLTEQQKKLELIDPELKEINFSLKRAKKKVTEMSRQLSKDKFIICLIVLIVIIIITIIIASACGKNKDNNKSNLPLDIFSTNTNKNNNNLNNKSSSGYLSTSSYIINIFILLSFYFL